jgi:DNA-binding NtrC family response regulator
MVARAIHVASERRAQPMVAVNCSALPASLIEAELFGHVKGAFTDAGRDRAGLFEQANRGTIFLDEIGDMPLELQAKILRVLQYREFQRLGSSQTIRVDVRVIAATNVDLAARVREGRFREDLYYRLNVVQIQVPALRERPGDIPALARHFVEKFCAGEGIPLKRITPDAFGRLSVGLWPGNVRQLENAVEQAVALSGSRELLHASDFPPPDGGPAAQVVPIHPPGADDGLDFDRIVGDFERRIIGQALAKTAGNKKRAADLLGLKRTTLTAKLKSLQATA